MHSATVTPAVEPIEQQTPRAEQRRRGWVRVKTGIRAGVEEVDRGAKPIE